jgi:hypothetical protein
LPCEKLQYGIQQQQKQSYNNTVINTVYVIQYCASPSSDEKAMLLQRKSPIKKKLIVLYRLYPYALCNTTSIQVAVSNSSVLRFHGHVGIRENAILYAQYKPVSQCSLPTLFLTYTSLSFTIHFKMLRPTCTTCFSIKNSAYCPHRVLVGFGWFSQ